jgi:hypothetical protein
VKNFQPHVSYVNGNSLTEPTKKLQNHLNVFVIPQTANFATEHGFLQECVKRDSSFGALYSIGFTLLSTTISHRGPFAPPIVTSPFRINQPHPIHNLKLRFNGKQLGDDVWFLTDNSSERPTHLKPALQALVAIQASNHKPGIKDTWHCLCPLSTPTLRRRIGQQAQRCVALIEETVDIHVKDGLDEKCRSS